MINLEDETRIKQLLWDCLSEEQKKNISLLLQPPNRLMENGLFYDQKENFAKVSVVLLYGAMSPSWP